MNHPDLTHALAQAVERRELVLHYQPQVDLRTGRVASVEALLRWDSAAFGLLSPQAFIPLAESTGLIVPVGHWVLQEACRQAAAWHLTGTPVRVHVNVSARQLAQGDLLARVEQALLAAGVAPALLGIEITESLLTDNCQEAARTLTALRALGIEIALDDFGTGYSNLSTLRALPIDVIKMDRSYVHDVAAPVHEISVTRAVIKMAHNLQRRVLAEGVESEDELHLLAAQGCDLVQGFYFSAPVAPEALAPLLAADCCLPERLKPQPPRTRTLLLVDDEPHVLAALKRSLRRSGWQILTACSGPEGLAVLAQVEVDVIVSDQRMPGMTGVEFLRQAKDHHPDTVRIVLSGYTELESITSAINTGAIYKFLTKPWDDELLRANIDEAFRQKGLGDENRRLDQKVRQANAELAALNLRLQQALAHRGEELSTVAEHGRHATSLLHRLPVALIGLDADGMVVLVNDDAQSQLPGSAGWLGSDAAEVLPADLVDHLARGGPDTWLGDLNHARWWCRATAVTDARGTRSLLAALWKEARA